MRKFYILLTFILTSLQSFSQSVLFVDDSGDQFSNSEILASTLDSLGTEYYYYDAYGLNQAPLYEEMLEFDVVLWHTSTWGVGLHLWNKDKTINPELVKYLDDPKSKFWLIGNDFMYDKYSLPVVDFTEGDFALDYLGISQYKAQSYANDGNVGVESVVPTNATPINVETLTWSVGNLWYGDAFNVAEAVTPVYSMRGNDTYPLNGEITGHLFPNPDKGTVLVYGFDLSLAENFDMMKENVREVLRYFNGLSNTRKNQSLAVDISVYPNPTNGPLNINITSAYEIDAKVELYNLQHIKIADLSEHVKLSKETWNTSYDMSALPQGYYYVRVSSKNATRIYGFINIK